MSESETTETAAKRRCSAVKTDGQPCGAYAVGGSDLCAGHGRLGFAADPVAAGRRGAERTAQVRREAAEERQKEQERAKLTVRERLAVELSERLDDVVRVMVDDALATGDRRTVLAVIDQAFGRPTERVETTESVDLATMTADQLAKLRGEIARELRHGDDSSASLRAVGE